MRDKHIKTWLFVFVGTLTVASGAASFFAQQKTLYKGLEPLGNFAQASVLTTQPVLFTHEHELPPEQTVYIEETPAKPSFEPVASKCGSGEKPIIKNSQITGCTPDTCESQGRFTYTGEDRPGLLYGMCIDCLTTEFAANGEKGCTLRVH